MGLLCVLCAQRRDNADRIFFMDYMDNLKNTVLHDTENEGEAMIILDNEVIKYSMPLGVRRITS